jgi:SprT protein
MSKGISEADKKRIEEVVLSCLFKAQKFFKTTIATVDIEYSDRLGKTAGTCHYALNSWGKSLLKFNNILFNENKEDFLKRTVPHEVAHHVVHSIYGDYDQFGKRVMPHGKYFKNVMQVVFGCTPEQSTTYHSFDTTNSTLRAVKRPYLYRCSCQDHPFTTQKHNRVRKGYSYICTKCKEDLYYVGENK